MAIIQAQRSAIEELRGYYPEATALPAQIELAQLTLDNGMSLHMLGISERHGSYSDAHGMSVLVLGVDSSPSSGDSREVRTTASGSGCAYAVLLRTPTKRELDQWSNPDSRNCLMCVELLRLVELSGARAIFGRTGKYVLYPELI